MKQSDFNHLRRLLGWVRCDIGQDPAGQQQTMIDIAGKLDIDSIDAAAKARLVEGYRRAEAVPVYVRDAVKALEKALTAGGRDLGVVAPGATTETRANTGFDPGADAGREPVLDDVQIELGLAEIGVYVWGQRGEDWLAGAEYAARILRGGEANPAAAPLQNHPDAAVWPVTCRVAPAAPPTLRRDDTGGASEARLPAPAHVAQEVQVDHETAGPAESGRPAITLQVMQEALRLMPSDEARRVAREAGAVAGTVTPEQYVGAGAVEVIAKLCASVADERGLLPCPFCGSEAFATFKTGDDDLRRHSVHCKSLDCGGQTRDRHFSEAKAIAAWNRRAALASAPVAGEAKNYPGDNVAERLDNMADDQPPGSQAQSDLYAAATIWRKHITHRAAPQASDYKVAVLPDAPSLSLAMNGAPQASAEDVRDAALEVARDALMEIADLADVEADQRGVIVNQALTKIAEMTAAPQADKDGAVDKSPNPQGSSVDGSTDLQGRADDVVLPPLGKPPSVGLYWAASEIRNYARAAVLADRKQRAGDVYEALTWYAEKVAGCRKIGSDGDAARQALDKDGGQRARAALSATQEPPK